MFSKETHTTTKKVHCCHRSAGLSNVVRLAAAPTIFSGAFCAAARRKCSEIGWRPHSPQCTFATMEVGSVPCILLSTLLARRAPVALRTKASYFAKLQGADPPADFLRFQLSLIRLHFHICRIHFTPFLR